MKAGQRKPYWTVAPALIALVGLSLYPIANLVWISLHHTQVVPVPSTAFVGFTQYLWILQDPDFWNSARVTIQFVVVASIVELLLGLGIALLLDFEGRGVEFLRMLFLLPSFLAPVVVALTWALLLNAEFGVANYLLHFVGVTKQAWLSEPTLAFASLVVADVWQWTPFTMLLILAGLRGLPHEPFEAAAIDGADRWQTFRHLTLPLLRPVLAVALLLRALDAAKVFGLALVLTGGGPGNATNVMGVYILRKAFEENQLQYAAGISVLFLVVALSVALVYSVTLVRDRSG